MISIWFLVIVDCWLAADQAMANQTKVLVVKTTDHFLCCHTNDNQLLSFQAQAQGQTQQAVTWQS